MFFPFLYSRSLKNSVRISIPIFALVNISSHIHLQSYLVKLPATRKLKGKSKPSIFVYGISSHPTRQGLITSTASSLYSLLAALTLLPKLNMQKFRYAGDIKEETCFLTIQLLITFFLPYWSNNMVFLNLLIDDNFKMKSIAF